MHMVFKTVGQKVFHEDLCVIGVFFRINDLKATDDQRAVLNALNPRVEKGFIEFLFFEIKL